MEEILVGIFALIVGLVFCFSGYFALRVVIPIWGAFAGFMLGAGLVDNFTDEGFLASALGWIVGLAVALVFGVLAYVFYEISVIIAMGAIGFALGSTLMWRWGSHGRG